MKYRNMQRAMDRENITKTDVSRLLDIHFNTVTSKINCNTTSDSNKYQVGFTFLEAAILQDTFFKNYNFRWLFDMDSANEE